MDAEVKELWLKALRSGEYRQGTGKLCRANKHCCLGVLTDLYVKSEIGKRNGAKWEEFDGYGGDKYLEFTSDRMIPSQYKEDSVLPDEVMEWAGLQESDPTILPDVIDAENNAPYSCCGLNDSGSSFDEIANYIEKALPA